MHAHLLSRGRSSGLAPPRQTNLNGGDLEEGNVRSSLENCDSLTMTAPITRKVALNRPYARQYSRQVRRSAYGRSQNAGTLPDTFSRPLGRVCQLVEKINASSTGMPDVTYAAFFT
jgi:hypothetical protein